MGELWARLSGEIRRRLARARAAGGSAETGGASVEYVGAVLAVGVLFGSVVAVTPAGAGIANAILSQLCTALGTECGAANAATRAVEEEQPDAQCEVSAHGDSATSGSALAFLIGQQGEEWSIAQMSDGTYVVRSTVDGEAGARYALGNWQFTATQRGQGTDINALVNAGALAGGSVTSEWTFDSQEDAEAFVDDWGGGTTAAADSAIPIIGAARGDLERAYRSLMGAERPYADVTYLEGGVTAFGGAEASGLLGVSADVHYSDALTARMDHTTGDMTLFTEIDLGETATGQIPGTGDSASMDIGATGTIGVTYDKNGTITEIEFQAAATADGSAVVQALADIAGHPASAPFTEHPDDGVVYSATVPVTPVNRGHVEALVSSIALSAVGTPGSAGATYSRYTRARVAAAQEIIAMAARQGDTTAVFSHTDQDSLYELAVGVGISDIGIGAGVSGQSTDQAMSDAYYLGDAGWNQWTLCAG